MVYIDVYILSLTRTDIIPLSLGDSRNDKKHQK